MDDQNIISSVNNVIMSETPISGDSIWNYSVMSVMPENVGVSAYGVFAPDGFMTNSHNFWSHGAPNKYVKDLYQERKEEPLMIVVDDNKIKFTIDKVMLGAEEEKVIADLKTQGYQVYKKM